MIGLPAAALAHSLLADMDNDPDNSLPPLVGDTPAQQHSRQRAGLMLGMGSFVCWGFIPVYFKIVSHVPAMAVLAHRIVWSAVFLAIIVSIQGGWRDLLDVLRMPRAFVLLLASAAMVAANWLIFIWAVSHNYVLQASLGYFITPLFNVLLGVVFLRERLRPWQVAGIALAAAGVVILTVSRGQFPWIAIGLTISFGLYGLLRKVMPAGSLAGLMIETAILFPVGLLLALRQLRIELAGPIGFDLHTYLWLSAAGVITAVPLLLFAGGARRLRLTTLGFLQYITPTCQFLLAVLAWGEIFTPTHMICFGLIWTALAIYSADALRAQRTNSRGELSGDQVLAEC